jgi:AraC family transcriptional regulator
MTALSPPKIEAFQKGRQIPLPGEPVLSSFVTLGEEVVLQKHVTPYPAEYPEHEHRTHVLFLPQGMPVRVDFRIEGKRFKAKAHPGQAWIIPRAMPHSVRFSGKHAGLLLSIGIAQFERHVHQIAQGRRIELIPGFNLVDGQLEHLLSGLLTVAQDASFADALVGELIVNAICIRLAKCYATAKPILAPRRGGLPLARLNRVLEFIHANLDKKVSLSALAEAAHMNMYYFASLFRQSMGVSPHQYVLDRRVERAKQLLSNQKLSVLDVGLRVGFSHQNNFARAFRRQAGVSPGRFRKDCL